MARRSALLAALLPLISACATIPDEAGGRDNLPNAGFGPFRPLQTTELGNLRTGPNALEDDDFFSRHVAVLDLDGDPSTFDINGYFGAAIEENGMDPEFDAPTKVILRHGAIDGRSFDRAKEPVLIPDQDWEGGVIGAPAALRVGGEVFLYYAAAGGIGLARGDGVLFTKEPGPVLGPDAGGWEKGASPASPGVVIDRDGSFRMFYEVPVTDTQSVIGEARSDDGITWTRVGSGPALGPNVGGGDANDLPYDGLSVGSPFPILATSGQDRPILRVYYGATDGTGRRTIGLAARHGDDEPFQRAVGPVFGSDKPLHPREPCVIEFEGFTLIFASQRADNNDDHEAVAVGVAPATASLPKPAPLQ